MNYMVNVSHIGGDRLGALMAEMRTWLDHNRIEPEVFQNSSEGSDVTFWVGFSSKDDAAAFAKVFAGQFRIFRSAWGHPMKTRIAG